MATNHEASHFLKPIVQFQPENRFSVIITWKQESDNTELQKPIWPCQNEKETKSISSKLSIIRFLYPNTIYFLQEKIRHKTKQKCAHNRKLLHSIQSNLTKYKDLVFWIFIFSKIYFFIHFFKIHSFFTIYFLKQGRNDSRKIIRSIANKIHQYSKIKTPCITN